MAIVEGPAYNLFTRACGLLGFFVLCPFLTYNWSRKAINPDDFSPTNPIVLACSLAVSALLVLTACGGSLLLNFARMRLTDEAIEWSFLHTRRAVKFGDILYITTFRVWFIPQMFIKIMCKNGKTVPMPVGAGKVRRAILELQSRFREQNGPRGPEAH